MDKLFSNCVLLVGPSCIGKTEIIRKLKKTNNCVLGISLDSIVKNYAIKNKLIKSDQGLDTLIKLLRCDQNLIFRYGVQALESFLRKNQDNKPVLIDVGAGFLDSELSAEWIKKIPSIYLSSTIDFSYKRYFEYRRKDFSFQQYKSIQFSELRKQSYSSAWRTVNCEDIEVHQLVKIIERTTLMISGTNASELGKKL